jgi:hypothetical protein
MFKKVLAAAAVVAISLSLGAGSVSARSSLFSEMRQDAPRSESLRNIFPIFESRENLLHVKGSVLIHDTTKSEVYDFVSNLDNDTQWYPGTLTSELVSGNGGPGSVYHETIVFGGTQANITATVLAAVPNNSFWFTSDGLLTNLTRYRLQRRQGGDVEFTLSSVVQVPEGVTQADMENYLTYAFTLLLGALGKTGEITIQ